MIKKSLTINLETVKVILRPITARQYYNYSKRELPISRDWDFAIELDYLMINKTLELDLPRCYAALKTLFGESTTMFDDYKCSFGYPFLLDVYKNNRKNKYILNFTDLKGSFIFFIEKVLPRNELKKYDLITFHEPFDDEFSKEEIRGFKTWFIYYLVGFMKSYQEHYHEEFFRSIQEPHIVFGYKSGNFFVEYFKGETRFWKLIDELKAKNIPYNKVTPN